MWPNCSLVAMRAPSWLSVRMDDMPSRRLPPDLLTRKQAEAEAKTIARTERDKLTGHGA